MKRSALWTAVIVATAVVLTARPAAAGPFLAYSLKQAEARLRASPRPSPEVIEFGGMTRLAGLVHDTKTQDIILVGQVDRGESPITLHDFVVALRALSIHKRWPLVSIDKTPETPRTGKQTVRFEGGIAETEFGRALLAADVILKRLGLGLLPTEVWGMRSYLALSVESAEVGDDQEDVSTRFWFFPLGSSFATRDGVFAISQLRVGVRAQVVSINGRTVAGDPTVRDALGDRFAQGLTAQYHDLGVAYPEVRRLKALFDLVALAKGIQDLPAKPDLHYFLHQHRVPRVGTAVEYPVLRQEGTVRGPRGLRRLVVDGGIELNPLVLRLRDGDVTALRDAVLRSRPSGTALTWRVPLEGWQIPGTLEAGAQAKASENPAPQGSPSGDQEIGAHLTRRLGAAGTEIPSVPPPPVLPPVGDHPKFELTPRLPLQPSTGQIGGVLLRGTATLAGGGEASVDLLRGDLSLIVEGERARPAPETFSRFVTALWAVYFCDQDPGVSIDPIAPGMEKHLVRYIGCKVINSDLGRVMREADYDMKKGAVGTKRFDVPGFKAVDDHAAKHGLRYLGASRRFWFVPEEMRFRLSEDMLLFDGGRMTLKTQYRVQDKTTRADPADEAFAQFFTEHYHEIAEKHPIYRGLFEYAKLVSLAKYVKDRGVPLLWFLLANKDMVLTEDSPGTVDALARGSKHFPGVQIEGGVDLGPQGQYVFDTGTVRAIRAAAAARAAAGGPSASPETRHGTDPMAPEPVSFNLGDKGYSVVPQHTLTSGRDRRGIRYQTDLALGRKGKPGLELVRYFDPNRRGRGEFGEGWHLLVPYRVTPAGDARREFRNVRIPERMAVEDLLAGTQEVLTFSITRHAIAGYVPEDVKASQVIGVFLMSDGTFRLADKLGNEFWFDRAGHLTDMRFTREHHLRLHYVRGFTKAFDRAPYEVRPGGPARRQFRNFHLPERMDLVDLIHGGSEQLVFSEKGTIAGYVPEPGRESRYRLLALLSDGSFRLQDNAGNEIAFTPAGAFDGLAPSPDRPMVASVSLGEVQRVTFTYTVDKKGHVRIAQGQLADGGNRNQPTEIVRYHHDEEGRLLRVIRGGADGGVALVAPGR